MNIRPHLTRSQAVKANCLECMGFVRIIRKCPDLACPLWPFRMGTEMEHPAVPLRPGHYERDADETPDNAASKSPGRHAGASKGSTACEVN